LKEGIEEHLQTKKREEIILRKKKIQYIFQSGVLDSKKGRKHGVRIIVNQRDLLMKSLQESAAYLLLLTPAGKMTNKAIT